MSEPSRVIYGTLEQILSADLVRTGRLAGRAAQDLLVGLVSGPDTASFTPLNVVREGLLATVGAGLSVNISAGELCRFNSTVLVTADESRYRLARLAATQNVVLTPADPAQPRIDLIQATEATNNTDNQLRNVLQLPARTVVPTVLNKTAHASITISKVDGVAGSTPAFPALAANNVALWYVYVPAAAAAVNDNHLMDARQFLRTNDVYNGGSHSRTPYGVQIDPASLSNVRLPTGVVQVSGGGLAVMQDARNYALATVIQSGEAAVGADTEVDFYLVARGNGTPVGKAEPNGVVPSATGLASAAPPNEFGTPPGGGINYYPLFSQGLTNVVFTTTKAAYIGTMHTGATAGQFDSIGGGLPLDRGGRKFATAIAHDGKFPIVSGLLRPPRLRWVSATQVAIDGYGVVLNQVPTSSAGVVTFDITDVAIRIDAEAADTWYYCYLRAVRPTTGAGASRGAVRRLIPKISTEAPTDAGFKPTPEAGFQTYEYLFVGAFRNNAASNIEPFYRAGELVLFRDPVAATFHRLHNADLAVNPALTTITAVLPASSRVAIVQLRGQLDSGAGAEEIQVAIFHDTGNAVAAADCRIAGNNNRVFGGLSDVHVHVNAAGQFEAFRGAFAVGGSAFTAVVYERGYVEDLAVCAP